MDFSRYQPPGVYVEDVTTPVSQPSDSAIPITVALLGPSRGFRSFTETVTLDGVETYTLQRQGIQVDSIIVRGLDGATYSLGVDYETTQDEGENNEVSYDNNTTVARMADSDIEDGETVTVSYRFADAPFFNVQKFVDLESVEAMYGRAFDTESGTVISPLSMAARVAFENGALDVATLDIHADDPEAVTQQEIVDGLNKIANDPDIGIVVPLPVGITETGAVGATAEALRVHTESTANERNFRLGIYGYERGVTQEPDVLAKQIEYERVMLAYPNRMLYYNGATNRTVEVAGYYLAAAYAGQLIRNGLNQPLTHKRIRGFAGLPGEVINEMTRSKRNTYSSRGVSVAELTRNQQLICRHGVMTDMQNVLTREPSIIRSRDAMVIRIENSLSTSRLIGSAITSDTPLQVKGIVAGALEGSKLDLTIVDYKDLAVRQVSLDPTIIEVRFAYKPAYPLNYIVVSFAVDVASGEVDAGQQVSIAI